MRWADPDEFAKFLSVSDQQMAAVMKSVGLSRP
jgi:hypothetical protein